MMRMAGMAAGAWGRLMDRSLRRWLGGVAAAAMATLAMAAPLGPAAGQEVHQTYTVPKIDYRPLALAYLAAPYTGSIKGASSDFRWGPVSPGTSINARFLKAATEHAWQGIPVGLFLGDRRLTVSEGSLGLGNGKPINLAVYAFLDGALKVRYTFKMRTFDSNLWRKHPDSFSLLSDTSFFLQEDVPPPVSFTGAFIACVNERNGRAGTPNDPPCREEEGGQVIEDPVSEAGEPALLMLGRSGRPDWLTKVATDICALEADQSRLPKIDIPVADGRHHEIALDRFEDRWCIRVTNLNYVAVLKDGIRVDDTLKMRLDSRLSKSGSAWKMLAAAPKRDGVQQIVLYPPVSLPHSSEPQKLPPEPESTFGVLLAEKVPQAILRIKALWYGSMPNAGDGQFKCEDQTLSTATGSWAKKNLIPAERVEAKLQGGRRLVVTEPQKPRANLRQPLALIAEAEGRTFCGIAMPVQGADRQFTTTLLPNEEKAAPPEGKDKVASSDTKAVPPPSVRKQAVAAGPPVVVVFSSPDKSAKKALSHSGGKTNEDGEGIFYDIDRQQLQFTLAPESNLVVARCEAKQLTCRPDGKDIELLPKEGVALPKSVKQVVVNIEFAPLARQSPLVFRADGPPGAVARIQLPGELLKLGGSSGRTQDKSVSWKLGDKIKVSLEDSLVYRITAITADKNAIESPSDSEVEIPITEGLKAVSIATDHRRFSGSLTIAARGGGAYVAHGEKTLDVVEPGELKQIKVDGAKHGDELSVRPMNPEFEVAKIKLQIGQKTTFAEAPVATFILKLDRSHLGAGDKLAALSLEADLAEIPVLLPTDVLLKPAVRLGKRLLPLQSCKVTLSRDGTKIPGNHGSKGTLVTFGKDQSVPKSGKYAVELELGANISPVCRGLEAEASILATKFKELGQDRTLQVPVRRPGSRAFVAIVSLSEKIRPDDQNWGHAMEALSKAFDAGAPTSEAPKGKSPKGEYVWGAIYGPDGKVLVKSEAADPTPLDIAEIFKNAAAVERLTGSSPLPFESLVDLVVKDVADFEGNVDMLVVGEPVRPTCGWSNVPHAKGSRAALVRLAGVSLKEGSTDLPGMPGVRRCDYSERSDKAGVVGELEVVPPEKWNAGVLPHMQLKRAIEEAAKSLRAESTKTSQ
jgi:hypothetical protein